MRKTFWFIVIFLLFLLATVNAVLLIPPTGFAKRLLVEKVEETTGLDLTINGQFTLRLLPNLKIRAENAVLAQRQESGGRPVLSARAIEITTDILPFIRGRRTIDHVHLEQPRIEASIDAAGRANWQIRQDRRAQSGQSDPRSRQATPIITRAQVAGQPATGASTPVTGNFSITNLSITDGTLTFKDDRTRLTAGLENFDATASGLAAEGAKTAALRANRIAVAQADRQVTFNASNAEATGTGIGLDGRIAQASFKAEQSTFSDARDKISANLTTAAGSATAITTDSLASATFSAERLSVRDATNSLEAKLENVTGQATRVAASGIGELIVRSSKASALQETRGASTELTGLSASATGISADSIAGLTFDATNLNLQPSPQAPRIRVAGASSQLSRLTLEGAHNVSLAGTSMTISDAAGALILAARDARLDIPRASIPDQELRDASFKSAALDLGEPSRATSPAFTAVSAKAPVIALGKPIEPEIDFVWKGEPVKARAKLPPPEAIALATGLPATLQASSRLANLSFDGRITAAADPARANIPFIAGTIAGSASSLRSVANWLGYPLAPGADGQARLEGKLEARTGTVSLSEARIEHNGQSVRGTINLDTAAARPRLNGRLTADKLDADRYLELAAPPKRAATRSAPRQTRQPEAALEAAAEDVIKEQLKSYLRAVLAQPVTRGRLNTNVEATPAATTRAIARPSAGHEWDSTPFQLAALNAMDLDLELSVATLNMRGMTLKVPMLRTRIAAGALQLDGQDIATDNARFTGSLTFDASQPIPTATTRFKAENLDVFAMLTALGVDPVLAGASTVEADLTSRGASQRQLAQAATGTLTARIDRGNIVGYDLTSFLSLIGLINNSEYNPSRRTPFDKMTASMVLDKGVTSDSRLQLTGRSIDADGNGTIKLAEQELDYRAQVKLSSWFRRLAVRLIGDWSNLKFGFDYPTYASKPDSFLDPAEVFPDGVFRDREISRLASDVLTRAGPRGLEPGFAAFLGKLRSAQVPKRQN